MKRPCNSPIWRSARCAKRVSATGRVEPREVIAVTSEVPGTVAALFGKINDVVPEEIAARPARRPSAPAGVRACPERRQRGQGRPGTGRGAEEGGRAGPEVSDRYREKRRLSLRTRAGRGQGRSSRSAGVMAAESQLQASETTLKKAREALEKTQIKAPGRCKATTCAPRAGIFSSWNATLSSANSSVRKGRPLFLVTKDLGFRRGPRPGCRGRYRQGAARAECGLHRPGLYRRGHCF